MRYDCGNGVISEVDENYVPLRNKANDYLIDRKLQKTKSYTGIKGVSEQDAAVQDSQGPIADRTREHLGPTDLGIMHFRKLIMESARALQQGQPPAQLAHQDRYAVRSGACVTHKAKDLPAVMIERFGDATQPGAMFRRQAAHGGGGVNVSARRGAGSHNGILRYSRLARLASSRSRSRSIRRRISSVILPSRSNTWMNFRSAAINSARQVGARRRDVMRIGIEAVGQLVGRISCLARSSLITSSDNSRSSVMASSDFNAAPSASRRAAISDSCSAACSSRPARAMPSQPTTGGSPSPSPTSVMKMTPKLTNKMRSR